MAKKRYQRGKRMREWFENHPVWVVLGITSSVLTLAVAAGTVFSLTINFIDNSILWKNVEQERIDKLAPTQTLSYFNSVLGEPNVKKVRIDEITTYIYKERGYWVEAFVDKEDVVQMMDITACGDEGFYPIIKNNPVGSEVVLGKTKMIATTGQTPWRWSKEGSGVKTHYYLRGASAPSYYFDEYYGGNPSSYQTVFSGHNELCGYLVLPDDIEKVLTDWSGRTTLNEDQVNRLRSNVIINTFAVTSPSYDLKLGGRLKNVGNGGIGVSYIDEGVLLPTKETTPQKEEKYKNAREYEVVRFN